MLQRERFGSADPGSSAARIRIGERKRVSLVKMGTEGGIARMDFQGIGLFHPFAGPRNKAEEQLLGFVIAQRYIPAPFSSRQYFHLVLFDADQPGYTNANTSMPRA